MSNKKLGALNRQKEIYLDGYSGIHSKIPFDFCSLKEKAIEKLSKKAQAYIAGGAGIEQTMSNNRSAFAQYSIIPRMLRDVSERNIEIELHGHKVTGPLLLAPIGGLEMCHREADIAVAKAAAATNIPMIFSSQASKPMEACAAAMGGHPRWFQLYWGKSEELVKSFLSRAKKSGCSAIVVTLDTTMLGWRTRDLNEAFLPFLHGIGIAQYTSDPVFQTLMDEHASEASAKTKTRPATIGHLLGLMKRYPGGFFDNLRTMRPLKAVRTFTKVFSNATLTWENLSFLRKHTDLPIILKGILHPEDAEKAVQCGMDGIIVSNHGGRQVDGGVGTLAMLPSIIKAVDGRLDVFLDSGIRTGADVFKAIALGAKAVCVGRPYVYGLAIDGSMGVETVIKNLLADFELTMGLSGCKSIEEISTDCLQ